MANDVGFDVGQISVLKHLGHVVDRRIEHGHALSVRVDEIDHACYKDPAVTHEGGTGLDIDVGLPLLT